MTENEIWDKLKIDMAKTEWKFVKDDNYGELAMTCASKLPNQTCQELLQNADKIYSWLIQRKSPAV